MHFKIPYNFAFSLRKLNFCIYCWLALLIPSILFDVNGIIFPTNHFNFFSSNSLHSSIWLTISSLPASLYKYLYFSLARSLALVFSFPYVYTTFLLLQCFVQYRIYIVSSIHLYQIANTCFSLQMSSAQQYPYCNLFRLFLKVSVNIFSSHIFGFSFCSFLIYYLFAYRFSFGFWSSLKMSIDIWCPPVPL